jgi:phage terminase small subunit
MRGSFDKDPQRRREDAPGTAPFNGEPPQHLPQECVRAWRYLVERLPKVALYSADEVSVELAARNLTVYWLNSDKDAEKALRHWLAKLGFSPVDRTRLTPAGDAKKNKFTDPD